MENCLNCGDTLHGDYCYTCGQKKYDPKDRTVSSFARNFFEESFSFDSKFFKSLKYLLFKPGFLTVEYFSGRVNSYITPLKMYLFVSVVSFFIGSLISPDNLRSLSEDFGLEQTVNNYISAKNVSYEVFEVKFDTELQAKVPLYFLGLVIAFSLPLKLVYLPARRLYAEHLVFALHFFSFILLMITVSTIIELVFPDANYFFYFLIPFVYLFLALHTAYKQNLVLSFFEAVILMIYYIGLLFCWLIAVFAVTLLTV
jgi:hypothetical protein